MTHILSLTRDDPVIHIKAYGGVQISGVDEAEVRCEIDAPQLATLVEEDGHVYVTVNSSCQLTVPVNASIEIEKGMGSAKISQINQDIRIGKILGNLILSEVAIVTVEKLGGNFSVKGASGSVKIEKVGGNLVINDVASFSCEKVGGNCRASQVHGDFRLEKAGGNFIAQDLEGSTLIEKVGGSLTAQNLHLTSGSKAGGDLKLTDCQFSDNIKLGAGGDVELGFTAPDKNLGFSMRSAASHIKVAMGDDDIEIDKDSYDYNIDNSKILISVAAGGKISVSDQVQLAEDLIGDISDHFEFEESALSELIQDRIESATRQAGAKIRAAEIRLEQMRERFDSQRGFDVDIDFGDKSNRKSKKVSPQPTPTVTRPAGKKGASDEERLMILKMLEEKKITVDEAETLFKALED